MNTIESTLKINLESRPQVDAYYKLLLALGGHGSVEKADQLPALAYLPNTVAEALAERPTALFKVDKTVSSIEEAQAVAVYELKAEARKRRTKAEIESDKLKSEMQAEEAPIESAESAENAEQESEDNVKTEEGGTKSLEDFRAEVARLTMSQPSGMENKKALIEYLKSTFGEFKADKLTGAQRAEAFKYMNETFTY